MNNKRKGFTMAEMLVVLLIIVIMASLLMPAAVSTKQRAQVGVCTSNVRQLYLALKLYQNDYDEYPPADVRFEAFLRYYPVALRCKESKLPEDLRFSDYLTFGSPVVRAMVKEGEGWTALHGCRDVRGDAIPLVMDQNHSNQTIMPNDTQSKYYIMREAGNLTAVAATIALDIPNLCDRSILARDYNY